MTIEGLPNAQTVSPFSELMLSPEQIKQAAVEIRAKGYCELAMSKVTVDLLNSVPERPQSLNGDGEAKTVDHQVLDLLGEKPEAPATENKITAVVEQLVETLCNQNTNLNIQSKEFCVRQPDKAVASTWHVDRAPKLITLLGTLRGPATQYLDRADGERLVGELGSTSALSQAEVPADQVKSFKKDHFYMIAAAGINKLVAEADPVPLLVHRAPGDEDRAFLLARWNTPGR